MRGLTRRRGGERRGAEAVSDSESAPPKSYGIFVLLGVGILKLSKLACSSVAVLERSPLRASCSSSRLRVSHFMEPTLQ